MVKTYTEEQKLNKKRYYEANKEKISAKGKIYYVENIDKIKEYKKGYRESHREEAKEYAVKYRETHPPKEYARKYRETHPRTPVEKPPKPPKPVKTPEDIENDRLNRTIRSGDCQKKRIRRYKIEAINTIARFHNIEVRCWRCSENRLWCLTIGHLNQDGGEDRKANGTGTKFYKLIMDGKRNCEDLQIECITCNYCLQWYGKYPDEITEEEFAIHI